MGGLCSKAAQAHQHWTLIDDVSAVVKNLKLTREEVEKFYKVFKEIDEAGYGRITPEQLINFVGYDSTNRLRMKMLQLMEPDQSLDGFIIVLWHICTMKPRDLAEYIFRLYDSENRGMLLKSEFKNLVEDAQSCNSAEHKEERKAIMKEYFGKDIDKITTDRYHEFCEKHANIMAVTLTFQRSLVGQIYGPSFWQKQSERRYVRTVDPQELLDLLNMIGPTVLETVVPKKGTKFHAISGKVAATDESVNGNGFTMPSVLTSGSGSEKGSSKKGDNSGKEYYQTTGKVRPRHGMFSTTMTSVSGTKKKYDDGSQASSKSGGAPSSKSRKGPKASQDVWIPGTGGGSFKGLNSTTGNTSTAAKFSKAKSSSLFGAGPVRGGPSQSTGSSNKASGKGTTETVLAALVYMDAHGAKKNVNS